MGIDGRFPENEWLIPRLRRYGASDQGTPTGAQKRDRADTSGSGQLVLGLNGVFTEATKRDLRWVAVAVASAPVVETLHGEATSREHAGQNHLALIVGHEVGTYRRADQ